MIFQELQTLEHQEVLIQLLTSNNWPFHGKTQETRSEVKAKLQKGFYTQNGKQTFLLFIGGEAVGFIRLFDLGSSHLDDETPLFDIRLAEAARGKGYGKQAIQWLNNFVFSNYPNKNRIEAITRYDNIAMRKVLKNCGYLKESHYRQAWRTPEGRKVDAVGYGILRQDWERGEVSEIVDWEN